MLQQSTDQLLQVLVYFYLYNTAGLVSEYMYIMVLFIKLQLVNYYGSYHYLIFHVFIYSDEARKF